MALALGTTDLVRVLVAAQRARTAADAAALAAAQELAIPSDLVPADVAAEYATRNGAELVSCACDPGSSEAVVEVRLVVRGLTLIPGDRSVTAAARAVVDLPSGG